MNAKTVFLEALELEDSARAHFIAEACAGDTGLEARVNALIRAHHDADERLPEAGGWIPGPAARSVTFLELCRAVELAREEN